MKTPTKEEKQAWFDGARAGTDVGLELAIRCLEKLKKDNAETVQEKLKESLNNPEFADYLQTQDMSQDEWFKLHQKIKKEYDDVLEALAHSRAEARERLKRLEMAHTERTNLLTSLAQQKAENSKLRSTVKNLLDYLKEIQENSGRVILRQLAETINGAENLSDQNKNCETFRGMAEAFKEALDKARYIN